MEEISGGQNSEMSRKTVFVLEKATFMLTLERGRIPR